MTFYFGKQADWMFGKRWFGTTWVQVFGEPAQNIKRYFRYFHVVWRDK